MFHTTFLNTNELQRWPLEIQEYAASAKETQFSFQNTKYLKNIKESKKKMRL